MSKRRSRSLANVPAEGRLDILCFKIVERVVKATEAKYKMPGLWDALEKDVERGIRQMVVSERLPSIPPVVGVLLRRFGG